MSDPTPPSVPPLPPPPPLADAVMPVASVVAPLPIAALPYSDYVRTGRPGILTAVGVISIVVAGLGFIGGLYSGLSLIMFNAMAAFAPMAMPAPNAPMPAVSAATMPAGVAPASSVVVTARGLESGDRTTVARTLGEMRFISSARAEQLDALLGEAGKDIFDVVDEGQALSTGRVQKLVLSHTTSLSANPAVPGPDTFRTESGRFELYDDRAVFYPSRGEIVRVSTLTNSTGGLSPDQVEQVVAQAQTASGNAMTPSQLAGLRTLLSAPSQQHVSVLTIPTAVRGAQPMGEGSVMITFPNGFAQIGPQGQIQMATHTAADGSMVTTSAGGGAFTVGGPGGGGGRVRANGAALAVAGFATLASGLLAAYLLVAGILVLRDSPRGRKLHLIYAWIKIPLALACALSAWWLVNSYLEAANSQAAAAGGATWMMNPLASRLGVQETVLAVLGVIYPIALLIVMQARGVKEYYGGVRAD
jgi:hypothetical protein